LARKRKFLAPVDDKTIAKRLGEIRKHRGFTQVEVAEALGLTQSLVSQYERGDIRIHSSLLAAFAKTLKVTADEILGLHDTKAQAPSLEDRRFLRRLKQVHALSRRDKQALLRTMDRFLGTPRA
jgi:transcriptional regulator with XRE-family HTH domain